MKRLLTVSSLACALSVLLSLPIGCQKNDGNSQEAVLPQGGLMPIAGPAYDPMYFADQKQVKLIERTVTYGDFDEFVAKNAEAEARSQAALEAKTKKPEETTQTTKGETEDKGTKEGLLGRLKKNAFGKLADLAKIKDFAEALPTGSAENKSKDEAEEKKEEPSADENGDEETDDDTKEDKEPAEDEESGK